MKNIKLITLSAILALVGCVSKTHDLKVKVLTPTGAPSIAFYNYSSDINFSTNNTVSNIVGIMNGTADYDVVVVDTTNGIQAINSGAPYKLASTITLGNFFIASTGKDANGVLDEGETVVLFGNQNAVPYKLFSYLYGTKINVEFCGGGVDKALQVLETGKNLASGNDASWVFIAQPYLFRAQNNTTSIIHNKNFPVINVQEKYKEKTGDLPLMQASVFIKNTVSKEIGNEFLNNLKSDILNAISNPNLVKEGMDKLNDPNLADTKFGVASETAFEVMKTNGLGLGYLYAKDNKKAIDSYISLFGMGTTNEEIYF